MGAQGETRRPLFTCLQTNPTSLESFAFMPHPPPPSLQHHPHARPSSFMLRLKLGPHIRFVELLLLCIELVLVPLLRR